MIFGHDRLVASRFSYGITPALAADVRRAGGGRAWLLGQLRPASIDDSALAGLDGWWPELTWGAARLWDAIPTSQNIGGKYVGNYQRYVLQRRIRSQRQVLEVLTQVFENHLNVPAINDPCWVHRMDYGRTVRAHALGRYADLLRACVLHPAMLVYLNQADATAAHPNENLGRELLEIHTVGVGAFGEEEVKASARLLTGWRVDLKNSWQRYYSLADHASGAVSVLGFRDPNQPTTAAEGQAIVDRYLLHLARHPLTAARVCRKLATKFVGDDVSAAYVDRLAKVYLDNDTAIVPVLLAIVDSPEFAASDGAKLRSPIEDVVATMRVLRVQFARPSTNGSAANVLLWISTCAGQSPLAWPRPDGAPVTNASWSAPARMIAAFNMHAQAASGAFPSKEIAYRPDASWLPEKRMRLDLLVDHLSRVLLHRPSTPTLLQACCLATGKPPGEIITRTHPIVRWHMHKLLRTVLDHPNHFLR